MKVEKRPIEKCSLTIAQQSCRKLIRFFQNYISDIDGPRSSFYTTSSQYALDAIVQFGVMKGIAMGCDRLMRENKEDWVYPTSMVWKEKSIPYTSLNRKVLVPISLKAGKR